MSNTKKQARPSRLSLVLTGFKLIFLTFLMIGLVFAGGTFASLLYIEFSQKTKETQGLASDPSDQTITSEENSDLLQNEDSNKSPLPPPKFARLDAPIIKQYPELYNGCEITSLAMLLQYYGVDKGKMELVPEMKIDHTPMVMNQHGVIKYWGDPDTGFVGDVTGVRKGYGIHAEGIIELLKRYIPLAENMTGQPFIELEKKIANGIPVMVWTTVTFQAPKENQWVTWNTPNGPVTVTFQEHTVLLVGYDEKHVYINDPRQGLKNLQVEKDQFLDSWEALGKQALSYEEFK
jgi:uncharacterized protein YvpB